MMTLSPVRRARVPLALLAVLLAGVLAGCGGSSVDRGSGPPTLRVIVSESINTALGNLPIDAGLAAQHGIALDRIVAPASGSTNRVSALLAGDAELAISGTNAPIDAISQGAELRIISGVGPLANSLTMARPVAERLGISEATPVADQLRALRGLRVVTATPGSAGYAVLVRLLADVGLDAARDVQLVPVQDNSAITGGLAQGTYDAAFAAIGPGEAAVASGDAVVLSSVPAGDYPQLQDFAAVVLFTTAAFADEHPDLVAAVRDTFQAGATMALEQPDAAAAALKGGSLNGMNDAVFTSAWTEIQPSAATVGPFTQRNWDVFLELFADDPATHYGDLDYASLVVAAP
jgi:NitT/TauT family transport system substrate-binding protein